MRIKTLMRGMLLLVFGFLTAVASFAQHATGSYTQVVNKAAGTLTTVTSSQNPSTYTQSVTFTVAVPTGATGTVQFLDNGVALGAPQTVTGAAATYTTTTLSVGTHPITASYSGDSNFSASTTSGTLSQVVNKGMGTLTVASGTNPSTFGQNVTFTATLASGATGTVTFYDNGVSIGTGTAASGTATFTTSSLIVGTHPITVQYAGDANFAAITTSNTVSQVVNKATSGVTDVLTVNPNPATYGQSITFTDTLPTNATGTVTFLDGSTAIGTGTLTNGVATLNLSTLTAGTHTITASYPGDSNYGAQSSNPVILIITKQGPTTGETITLTSDTNPAAAGATVTFKAKVPNDATGTVDFFDGATKIGTGTITAGVATFSTSTLAVGTHPITATYNGDSNYLNITSSAVSEVITQGTATVTINGVPNPSVYGQNVVMTITVTGVNGVAPTGTVTLVDGSNPLGSTLTLTPGSGGISTATYSTSALAAGSHPITATYSGDANYK